MRAPRRSSASGSATERADTFLQRISDASLDLRAAAPELLTSYYVTVESGTVPLRVFVVEPYFGGSHAAWAEGLARHSVHDVHLVTHAGGFWKWRMQGAALTLAREVEALAREVGRPDVVMVSDMVHVPALLGFARRALAGAPVALYFHENQLTYPLPEDTSPDHTYALINWLSAACAERVVFNSDYHRRDLLGMLPAFLRRFPDHRHDRDLAALEARTLVIPIGVDLDGLAQRGASRGNEPPLVLWNHRWEYDKDPETFFAALYRLTADGITFRVAIAGESFQTVPDAFTEARDRLGDRVVHFGTAAPSAYRNLLAAADVVVSTARHEFFGLAVAEAIAAGALPVLPDRLAYPELVPAAAPYLYGSADDLGERLRWALTDHAGRRCAADRATSYVRRFGWTTVAPQYDELFDRLTAVRP